MYHVLETALELGALQCVKVVIVILDVNQDVMIYVNINVLILSLLILLDLLGLQAIYLIVPIALLIVDPLVVAQLVPYLVLMVVNMRQVLDDLKNKVTNLICLYESFTKYKNIYEFIPEYMIQSELNKLYNAIHSIDNLILEIPLFFNE